MASIAADLTARVVIITSIFTIISYILIQRDNMMPAIPSLLVLFGVVIEISVLFDLRRYHVWNTQLSLKAPEK